MQKARIVIGLFIAISTQALYAEEEAKSVPPQPNIEEKPVVGADKQQPKIMRTNCYTNSQDCAGYTTVGAFNEDKGCTIWYNDGRNGQSNFTIRSGQKIEHLVRYNDTGACVPIRYAPPRYDGNRYYLYVHN